MSEPLLYHPHPEPGQIYSDWLLDTASGNVVSPAKLLAYLGVHNRQGWAFLCTTDHAIKVLAEATLVPRVRIESTLPNSGLIAMCWRHSRAGRIFHHA